MKFRKLDARVQGARVRLSASLVEEAKRGELEPRLTRAGVAGVAVAVAVHAFAAVLLVGGMYTTLATFPNPACLFGAFGFGLGLLILPLPPPMPEEDCVVLDRTSAPELFDLLDEIAATLGGGVGPDALVLTTELNAFWLLAGWRRRRVLGLGLPLWTALTDAERVAVLAHELGHDRNRDLRRSFLVANAVRGLMRWRRALMPRRWAGISMHTRLEGDLVNGLMSLLSAPVKLLLVVEVLLLMRESQRAEYRADALAAHAAGTGAALGLNDKLVSITAPYAAIRRRALAYEANERPPGDVIDDVRAAVASLTADDLAARRRKLDAKPAKLTSTHPRTADRIAALAGAPTHEPRLVLDPERSAAITAELEAHRAQIADWMLESARGDLYAGRPRYA